MRPSLSANLKLGDGELVALIGANGAGKTTLLKILSGLIHNADLNGQIQLNGKSISNSGRFSPSQDVLYVGPYLYSEFGLTVRQVVSMACHPRVEKTESALLECQAIHLADRPLNQLSGGEVQKVLLARAFAKGNRLLMLDETLSLMDLNHQAQFGRIFQEKAQKRECSFLWVSHDVNLALEWADRCYFLYDGKIHGGGTPQDEVRHGHFEKMYPDSRFDWILSPETKKPKLFIR